MKLFLCLLSFLVVIPAWAQKNGVRSGPEVSSSAFQIYLLNPEVRYERGNSQDFVDRKPLNLGVAYQLRKVSVLLEYTSFKDDTGNATSSIERRHQDLALWGRYDFVTTSLLGSPLRFYSGIGAGAYQEEVKTTLMGMSRSDESPARFFSGLSVGALSAMSLSSQFDFLIGVEGRILISSDFDPNPLWSFLVRLGFSYKF